MPSIALVSPLPLLSGMILVFFHFIVVGSFILLSCLTNVIIHLLLPISHPSSVSPPTTTTHEQKLLSTFPWSEQLLGNMHLHTLVHPCLPASLHESGFPEKFSGLHIIVLNHSHDPFLHLFNFISIFAKYWIFSCLCTFSPQLCLCVFVVLYCFGVPRIVATGKGFFCINKLTGQPRLPALQ